MYVLKQLERVQQIGCQAVVGALKSVSLVVAELEAAFISIESKLLKHQLLLWIKWHSKSAYYHFWKIKQTICLTNKRYIFLLQRNTEKFHELDLSSLEIIKVFFKAL